MATAYKVLGQLDLTTTNLTTLYTCPASTETVISTIIIANRNASADTFRSGYPCGRGSNLEHSLRCV
jgi:hypothetical protein